jgi:hypothetical protein
VGIESFFVCNLLILQTGKLEVMQTAEAAVFARMPSGQDSPKTPALATHSTGA